MYQKQFTEFFDESIPKLSDKSNIKILKTKITELDDKYSSNILVHSEFFGTMIKSLKKYKVKSDVIMYLIMNWEGIYEIDDLIVKIITNFACDPDDMKYIIQTIDTPSYDYMINHIIENEDEHMFGIMYENINICYSKKITQSLIEKQLSTASLFEKQVICDYLEMKQQDMSMYKTKPDYVSFIKGESKSMLDTVDQGGDQTSSVNTEDDLRTLSDKYIKTLSVTKQNKKTSNFDVSKAINIFMATKALANSPDGVRSNLRNRLWGPMNAIPNTNCYYNKNSLGPCRMLQCDCREDEGETWFSGMCMVCGIKIRNKSYAVRYPLEQGGWFGCFCSFKCIEDNPPKNVSEDEALRIKLTKETLSDDGIFDRLG